MDSITQASQDYIVIFNGYLSTFLNWGQWVFFSLLTINIVILCLWYAFDRDSFADSIGQFIRKFFVIAFFYSLMLNSSWLVQIIQSFTAMGETVSKMPIDPSSIVGEGISIANQVWQSVKSFNLITITSGAIMMIISYIIIIFCFISIALQLAITLIMTQLLVVVSTFFLGFAALSATSQIARNMLDLILANCVRLLGIYLVVGASSQTISLIEASIPQQPANFDVYGWLLAAVLLFWMLAKNVPEQLARIVTNVIQETRGTDAAALAMAATQYAAVANSVATLASAAVTGTAKGIGQATGSTAYSAVSHWKSNSLGIGAKAASVVAGTTGDIASSAGSSLTDHFKHMASKLAGGEGVAKSTADIPSFAQRMYQKGAKRFDDMKPKKAEPKA